MEITKATESRRRVIRRSMSHGAKVNDVDKGNNLVSPKAVQDEVDSKRPFHQSEDKKSDVPAKNKNRSLHNKLKRWLDIIDRSCLLMTD